MKTTYYKIQYSHIPYDGAFKNVNHFPVELRLDDAVRILKNYRSNLSGKGLVYKYRMVKVVTTETVVRA